MKPPLPFLSAPLSPSLSLIPRHHGDFLSIRESRRRPSDSKNSLEVMEHKEAECQTPEGPILCINSCGFFGSAATMNMCSKCHKDLVLKQEQAKLAVASIDSIVNGGGCSSEKELIVVGSDAVVVGPVNPVTIASEPSVGVSSATEDGEPKPKEGPSRCNTCRKRVGLTGFSCRCGYIFCATHRYSDKHSCPFDYLTEARDAIAKANPVIKTSKLDKI